MSGRPGLSMLTPSKIVARSMKNGSSAGPTNVLPPLEMRAHGARGHLRVVGDRLRPDVVGRDRHARRDLARAAQLAVAVGLAVEVVRLDEVDVRVVDGVDRRRRVQERARVAEALLELPAVGDVLAPVAGVVDLDVVARPRIELAEVRAARRVLERDPVRDDRQAARRVRRRERVEVGVVGRRIGEDRRRLPVAGADDARHGERPGRERGHRGRAQDGGSAHAHSLVWMGTAQECAPGARAVLILVASGSH